MFDPPLLVIRDIDLADLMQRFSNLRVNALDFHQCFVRDGAVPNLSIDLVEPVQDLMPKLQILPRRFLNLIPRKHHPDELLPAENAPRDHIIQPGELSVVQAELDLMSSGSHALTSGGLRGVTAPESGRWSPSGVACDKMTMYMDLLCLCHSTCLRYNESAGLTRRCMSFYARLANCQPPLIAPFDLCRLNSERNSYIRITTQAESALSCGGYW